QAGTLHFAHLAGEQDGLLLVAQSPAEHHAQLGDVLAGRRDARARRERFLRAFLRPQGLETPGAVRFGDAVEALAARGPAPAAEPAPPAAARLIWRVPLALS